MKSFNKSKIAVILCGGKGLRMGGLTKKKPKPLLIVHGKPIIWYSISILLKYKFNKIIFPLGYRGKQIKKYILLNFKKYKERFEFVDTGANSSISQRMHKIKNHIPEKENFIIINSDTIFKFNLDELIKEHKKNNNWLTLVSVDLTVKWGLIIFHKNKLISFDRSRTVSFLKIKNNLNYFGLINSGIAMLNKQILTLSKSNDYDFESKVYKEAIKIKKAGHIKLKGLWYPIDTDKDLKTINVNNQIIKKF
jgi:glucose-1-phosphate cytidylyltransferase